ncbi:sensor histidine kinase [Chitinophaga qingshengii]|uniref:Histidine kinase n=1 Tax=Chitinophaga qingshengii TaxID=1569794 RepID=A0ABR7TVC6_9BACT|nr:histidine kinase [Chitinophaga qingshengii]MBC9934445.1 histidine kinase [Chitinophaga qingshengii]
MRKQVLTFILMLFAGYVQAQVSADTTTVKNTDAAIKTIKSHIVQLLHDPGFVKSTVLPVAIMILSGLVSLVLLTLFVVVRRKQKRKLKYQEQQTREAKLRLQSIRSQLNPHFVYNALAGIQNLMNKNDNAAANTYLNRFSRLSRRVLEDADRDLITVEEEITLLDDYLKMEQLRFGFVYTITVDNRIDAVNTEIPSMLVQPFVENAVKHGMVTLKEGHVSVRFENTAKGIKVVIEDNGTGFDLAAATEGVGLELSKNRISLLNEVYKHTPVSLQVGSGETGTTITITLNDWLA